jgi:hypothetical protein
VTLSGELALDGPGARIIFRNNQKGTHERSKDLLATTVLIPAEQTIEIPTSMDGTPAEGPLISVQLLDATGSAVSDEILLGPCVAATFPAVATAKLTTTVTLAVTADGCENNPGPTITLEGVVRFVGLQARIIVRGAAGGPVAGDVNTRADIVALAAGETLSIPKQPVRGGVGGNPWIWARLMDAEGAALAEEILIGRCAQIADPR